MKKIFPMTLQLFAEGDGDGAGGGNVSGAGASGEGTNNEPLSFDGFLAQEGNQAEFDRRVQKAIDTAVSNAQQKWQALTDDKLSEAEKLAKMNKEEKAAYMQQKKEKELSDRESAVARKELMAEAKNTLAEKKLPAGLAEVLNYTDAETCNKSIAAVEKTFQAAVEAAVQERLKGGEPMKKAPESDADSMEKQVEALIMGRM
ncbi:MAG: DUF4355 domain-containing protein [Coprococcus sp.]